MPLLLTVTGYQPLTTVRYGLQRALVQVGILTPTGTGSGRITDGHGFLLSHGAGLHFIMEGGYTPIIMDGYGYQAPLGRLRG
jgi:hypothetical protein